MTKSFFKKNILLFAALICITGSSIHAQTVNDEQELQAFARRFMAAYNAQDQAAIRNMYTEDAVRIDQQGKQIAGADNIAGFYAEQFQKNNTTLLLKHTGINWSDAEHAWIAKGGDLHGQIHGRVGKTQRQMADHPGHEQRRCEVAQAK